MSFLSGLEFLGVFIPSLLKSIDLTIHFLQSVSLSAVLPALVSSLLLFPLYFFFSFSKQGMRRASLCLARRVHFLHARIIYIAVPSPVTDTFEYQTVSQMFLHHTTYDSMCWPKCLSLFLCRNYLKLYGSLWFLV